MNVIQFPPKINEWWEQYEIDDDIKTKTFCAVLADMNVRQDEADYDDAEEYYSMAMLLYIFQLIMRDNKE